MIDRTVMPAHRRHTAPGRARSAVVHPSRPVEDRSMRVLELATASIAIVAAVLLAGLR